MDYAITKLLFFINDKYFIKICFPSGFEAGIQYIW